MEWKFLITQLIHLSKQSNIDEAKACSEKAWEDKNAF